MKTKGKEYIWEDEDLEFLRQHHRKLSIDEIGWHLGCSAPVVRKKALSLGLTYDRPKEYKTWTDEQLRILRDGYPTKTLSDLATAIGYSIPTVKKKAVELGLQRAEDYSVKNFWRRYVSGYKHTNKAGKYVGSTNRGI